MTDIHHKTPDPRPHRWWRIPPITAEYKRGWNRIFKKPVTLKKTKKGAKT